MQNQLQTLKAIGLKSIVLDQYSGLVVQWSVSAKRNRICDAPE